MFTAGIIDDDSNFADNLCANINRYGAQCLIKAKSSERFFQYFKYEPNAGIDILFLDVKLDNENGLDVIPKIRKKLPNVDIIMFTMVEDADTLIKAFCLGATGYLLKGIMYEEFERHLNILQSGGAAISPRIAKKLIHYFSPPQSNMVSPFNEKEKQVLKLMAEGWSYKEVADKTGISVDGVRFYVKRIYKSLHINSKSELIRMYMDGKINLN